MAFCSIFIVLLIIVYQKLSLLVEFLSCFLFYFQASGLVHTSEFHTDLSVELSALALKSECIPSEIPVPSYLNGNEHCVSYYDLWCEFFGARI